jgi:hypothetical protein
MTKTEFDNLQKGDTVISNVVPTITYDVDKKQRNGYKIIHSSIMTNPQAWDIVKKKKSSKTRTNKL